MKQGILGLSDSQLREIVCSTGEPAYRADQILRWIYRDMVTSFEEMTDLPQPFRLKLASLFSLFTLSPIDEKFSDDGQTRKVLFRLEDGRTIESSFMLYAKTGSSRERRTVCVSTQVGCPIGCPFCATGQQGLERNLNAGEIVEQILYFVRMEGAGSLEAESPRSSTRRSLTNVVFMGMGEPLANYEEVWRCISILNSKRGFGLGVRQMTLSTVGLVPQIRRLASEQIHVELAVSLHAASDEVRDKLVPINRRYPLGELIPACREYLQKTGRRPTFEYALFERINDSPDQAHGLARLLGDFDCHVNLIVGNATANKKFKPSPIERVIAFQKELTAAGVSNTLRLSRGVDIEAGCGQLRSRRVASSTGGG